MLQSKSKKNDVRVGKYFKYLTMSAFILPIGCGNNGANSPVKNSENKNFTFAHESQGLDHGNETKSEKAFFVFEQSGVRQGKHLGLSKSIVGKDLLLRANVIEGSDTPMFENLKSRIVTFEKQDGKLYMFESEWGHTHYNEFEQKIILAHFDILQEAKEHFVIDFNKGMSNLYTLGGWYAQDLRGSEYQGFQQQFQNIALAASFIEKMTPKKQNKGVEIQQYAQAQVKNALVPFEVRYMLELYETNKSFNKLTAPKNKKQVGFFESNPVISQNDGKTEIYATKFDLSKKVTFAVSSNTPAEYVDVIKAGVLYWNKIFDREVLEVIDAPPGVTAPSYDYNVIQWIDWDEASYAYADAQMDPRTGEVLNAQVYLSSVFAVSGKERAESMLRKMDLDSVLNGDILFSEKKNVGRKQSHIAVKGLEPSVLCDYHESDEFFLQDTAFVAGDLKGNEEKALYFAQLKVLKTVAHEVGHTLGLRHNFAGSLAASYTLEDRDELFKMFSKDNKLPENFVATSSVMDYMPFKESVLTGYQVLHAPKSFSYDNKVMKVLYGDQKVEEIDGWPLYCTDSHVEKYIDCNRFDLGNSPVNYAKFATKVAFESLPYYFAEHFAAKVDRRYEDEEPSLLSTKVTTNSYKLAESLFTSRQRVFDAVTTDGAALWIDRQYDSITETEHDEVDEKYFAWITDEFQKHGNGQWKNILDFMPENFVESTLNQFSKIMEQDSYRLVKRDDWTYTFSDAEVDQMTADLKEYLNKLELSIKLADVIQLAKGVKDVSDFGGAYVEKSSQKLDRKLAQYLAEKTIEYSFETEKVYDEETGKEVTHNVSTSIILASDATLSFDSEEKKNEAKKVLSWYKTQKDEIMLRFDDQSPKKHYSEDQLKIIASVLLEKNYEQIKKQYCKENEHEEVCQSEENPDKVASNAVDEGENEAEKNDKKSDKEEKFTFTLSVEVVLPLNLPIFKYDYSVRSLSGLLLTPSKANTLNFALTEKKFIYRSYLKTINSNLRGYYLDLAKDLSNQPSELQEWVLENQKVMNSLI